MIRTLTYPITFITFLCYAAFCEWPLLSVLSQNVYHLDSDPSIFLWNLSQVKEALLHFRNPFFSDHLFYPVGDTLLFHTQAFFWGVVATPFLLFFDVIPVYNSIEILTFALAAFCMFLLVHQITRNWFGSFMAGFYFGFNPYSVSHLDHLNLLSTFVFPLFFFFYWQIKECEHTEKYEKKLISCAVVLLITFLADLQYLIFLLMIFVVLNALSFFFSMWRSTIKEDIKILTYFFVFAMPFIGLYALNFNGLGSVKVPLWEYSLWSADLMSFFVPSFFNSLLNPYVIRFVTSKYGYLGEQLYIGWTVIGLILGSLILFDKKMDPYKRSIVRVFLVCFFFAFVVSLGPTLKFLQHQTNIRLPHYFLTGIPFFNSIRCVSRTFILGYFSLAIIIGICLTYVGEALRTRAASFFWCGLVAVFMVFEFFSASLVGCNSGDPAITPRVFEDLNKTADNSAILQLPVGWSSGRWILGQRPMIFNYYAMRTKKKDVGGMFARVSDSVQAFFTNNQFFKAMTTLSMTGAVSNPEIIVPGLRQYNIGYIILHEKRIEASTREGIVRTLKDLNCFTFKRYPGDSVTLIAFPENQRTYRQDTINE